MVDGGTDNERTLHCHNYKLNASKAGLATEY